ncbi:MAG: phenylalanine--tRNA ligase subunit alpha, partial [Oxalobacteraceae bacterium]
MTELERAVADVTRRASSVKTASELGKLRAEVLGKKSVFAKAMAQLGALDVSERPAVGSEINRYRDLAQSALADAATRLSDQRERDEAKAGAYDVTLPGRRPEGGRPHPLRIVEQQIVATLATLGFVVAEGPLVEHEWHNFEALNIPADHPARDMQDTFFVAPRIVLRTHTSNVQVRTMLKRDPPVRIVAPGMVFRHDEVDATHSPVFHQVEGL